MAITNLTNTTWVFKDKPTYATEGTFNINFTSNGENFTSLYAANWGSCVIGYDNYATAYQSGWKNENYKTITITGGDDVENADLIAWLEANTLAAPEFTEVKVPLKIYTDLTEDEFSMLEKDEDSFYLVDDVGVYKGDKLIAKNEKVSVGKSYTFTKENGLIFNESINQFELRFTDIFDKMPSKTLFFITIAFSDGYVGDSPCVNEMANEGYIGPHFVKVDAGGDNYSVVVCSADDENPLTADSIVSITINLVAVFY